MKTRLDPMSNMLAKPHQSLILLDKHRTRVAAFAGLRPRVVQSVGDLNDSVEAASKDSLWISFSSVLTDALVKRASPRKVRLGRAMFLHKMDLRTIPVLNSLFTRIAFDVDGCFLPAEELAEVLEADNRADLVIGGIVSEPTQTITLWLGNLDPLTVPFAAFEPSGDGTRPNFHAFAVIDTGQTIKLGDYEAAVDALLYEFDPEFRRALAKKRLQEERNFGASLRRLRKQCGLRRADFEPDLSARTIARIEQGEVKHIRGKTLESLAGRLGVRPEDIESY